MYLTVKHHSSTHCCCIKAFYYHTHIPPLLDVEVAHWHISRISAAYDEQVDRSCQRRCSQIGDSASQLAAACSTERHHKTTDCTSLYRMTLLKLESNTLIDIGLVLHFDFAIAHHYIFLWLWHFVNWSRALRRTFIGKMRKLTKERKGRIV